LRDSRFSDATQIIPKNMNLLAVNVFVGFLAAYQLKRKIEFAPLLTALPASRSVHTAAARVL
jgi:hypothetical protein